jgi:hypothetical protein
MAERMNKKVVEDSCGFIKEITQELVMKEAPEKLFSLNETGNFSEEFVAKRGIKCREVKIINVERESC